MNTNRIYWVDTLHRVSYPVLFALSERRLKERMPVESKIDRSGCTHLEALGRTLCGLAPWLELPVQDGEEGRLRARTAELARRAIDAGTDPESPDYGNFGADRQTLVDAAFLAHAVVRAPNELWRKLDARVKTNLVRALKETRAVTPGFNNWLLFSAMVELGLLTMGEEPDRLRIDYALRQHEQWYKGDGIYGDGPEFHWDYYNSFVIQPMLVDILQSAAGWYGEAGEQMLERALRRAGRYAAVQEALISPEGTFPAIGRSIAYRCGAFQHLAQMALQKRLPDALTPAQVRCALQAVIRRCLEAPGTFDGDGWLRIGLSGHQPSLGERYISTGSLYLCTTAFLPLGLPADDSFWSDPDTPWSSQKLWSGVDAPADHALHGF